MNFLLIFIMLISFSRPAYGVKEFDPKKTKCKQAIQENGPSANSKARSPIRYVSAIGLNLGVWVVSVKVASYLGPEHMEVSLLLSTLITFVTAVVFYPRLAFFGDRLSSKSRKRGFGEPQFDYGLSHTELETLFEDYWESLNQYFNMNAQIGRGQFVNLTLLMDNYLVNINQYMSTDQNDRAYSSLAYLLKMMRKVYPEYYPDFELVVDFMAAQTLNIEWPKDSMWTQRILDQLRIIDPDFQQKSVRAYYQKALDSWFLPANVGNALDRAN